jgi:aryl-phospho-beta-D-glucosidase BglC (GH1 family)
MNPRVLKTEGFKYLDRVVEICAEAGIYTILDCHAAAGGQNTVRISSPQVNIAQGVL